MEIIGLSILGIMFAHWFTPIQGIKDWLVFKLPLPESVKEALYCVKCCAFWLTLLVTFNLYYAAISALLAVIFNYIINYIQTDE